jgi:hypothetical protein
MKHIVLMYFKEDADPTAVQDFLDAAPGYLADGPFSSYDYGEGLKILKSCADWGFFVELNDGSTVQEWVDSSAHKNMVQHGQALVDRWSTLQFA